MFLRTITFYKNLSPGRWVPLGRVFLPCGFDGTSVAPVKLADASFCSLFGAISITLLPTSDLSSLWECLTNWSRHWCLWHVFRQSMQWERRLYSTNNDQTNPFNQVSNRESGFPKIVIYCEPRCFAYSCYTLCILGTRHEILQSSSKASLFISIKPFLRVRKFKAYRMLFLILYRAIFSPEYLLTACQPRSLIQYQEKVLNIIHWTDSIPRMLKCVQDRRWFARLLCFNYDSCSSPLQQALITNLICNPRLSQVLRYNGAYNYLMRLIFATKIPPAAYSLAA